MEVYCPGKRRRFVAAPDADNVAPTRQSENMGVYKGTWDILVVLVYPWRHCPATQTTVGEDCAAA